MWRKLQISSSTLRSAALRLLLSRSDVAVGRAVSNPTLSTTTFSSRLFSSDADDKVDKSVTKKTVEDVLPIATGHEREEIEAELEGKKRFDMDAPCGPFGTKEAPAVIQSFYDKRIVGCPGGEGDDEHDVVWFWLEKDKPHECPVCSQYFMLEVVGPGGPPDGHGDDDDH